MGVDQPTGLLNQPSCPEKRRLAEGQESDAVAGGLEGSHENVYIRLYDTHHSEEFGPNCPIILDGCNVKVILSKLCETVLKLKILINICGSLYQMYMYV